MCGRLVSLFVIYQHQHLAYYANKEMVYKYVVIMHRKELLTRDRSLV